MIFDKNILTVFKYIPSSEGNKLLEQMFYDYPDCSPGFICKSTLYIEVLEPIYISPDVLKLSSLSTDEFLRLVGLEDNTKENKTKLARWNTNSFIPLRFYNSSLTDADYIWTIDHLLHTTTYKIENYRLKGLHANLDLDSSYDSFYYAAHLYFAVVFNYILSGNLAFNIKSNVATNALHTNTIRMEVEWDYNFVSRNAHMRVFQRQKYFVFEPTSAIEGYMNGVRNPVAPYDLSNRF